mgnify:CR=1 FL=1
MAEFIRALFGIPVLLLIYLVPNILPGLLARYLARLKGYDDGFRLGLFLSVIGVLLVIVRPTRNAFSKLLENGSTAMVQAYGQEKTKVYASLSVDSRRKGGPVLDVLPNGKKVKIKSCSKDALWAVVEYEEKEGYIKTMYLSEIKAEE